MTSKKLQDDKNALEVDKNDLNRKLGANEEKIAQLTEQKMKLQQDLESTKNSSLDVNSELSKLNNELREKQAAFESYQSEAETAKLNLERRVDELDRQKELMEQQCAKLKNEMSALQGQKIESENQLNQELSNIKASCDEEKSELGRQLNHLQSTFESDRMQLSREKQQIQETFDKSREEFDAKIRDLESTIDGLKAEVENAKMLSKENQSSMGSVVDELKKKESQISAELDEQRHQTDEAKKSLQQLELSKETLKSEYEEKLQINRNKISKLEDDLAKMVEQQNISTAGVEERIKILDDIQAKCYEQSQKITNLTHQLENEVSMKRKLEASSEESLQKFRELEDEQVDLVNRQELLKVEKDELERKIQQLNQLHKSLDEKFSLERNDSEHFKIVSEERCKQMEQKIDELNQVVVAKDQEKVVVIEKLHLREEEIVQLQDAVKNLEVKLNQEADETQKLLKGKDEELLKLVREISDKDNQIGDMKNNLENLQSCLSTRNNENESTVEVVQQLNETVSNRDFTIRELKMKIFSVEKLNNDIEDQLKNIMVARQQTASESQSQINDLQEQINILEQVKESEVNELSTKLSLIKSQLSMYENAAETSNSSLKVSQGHENELLLKIKDLEMRETELLLLNQAQKRKVEELETSKGIPRAGDAYDQEMQAHIEFLNSIISDMHKKNLKLTQKMDLLVSGSTSTG